MTRVLYRSTNNIVFDDTILLVLFCTKTNEDSLMQFDMPYVYPIITIGVCLNISTEVSL